MTTLPISLMIAYSFWSYLIGHSMTFVIYAQEGRSIVPSLVAVDFLKLLLGESLGLRVSRGLSLFFRNIFPFVVGFERILGLVFLTYLAYVSQWYLALILYAIGMVGQFVLVWIEVRIGLQKHIWLIISAGVILLPAILIYMILQLV